MRPDFRGARGRAPPVPINPNEDRAMAKKKKAKKAKK